MKSETWIFQLLLCHPYLLLPTFHPNIKKTTVYKNVTRVIYVPVVFWACYLFYRHFYDNNLVANVSDEKRRYLSRRLHELFVENPQSNFEYIHMIHTLVTRSSLRTAVKRIICIKVINCRFLSYKWYRSTP